MFNIATFASLFDLWPKVREGLSWPELVAVIGAPRPLLAKGTKKTDPPVPMFSAAVFEKGKTIAANGERPSPDKAAPVGAYFGVWDLDHVHTGEVHRALTALEAENCAYICATSWSHGQPAAELDAKKVPKVCPNPACRAGGLVKAVQGAGTTWLCGHCAHSWTTSSARVVIPFSRMVQPGDEWKTVWDSVERRLFNGLSDPKSRSIVQRYFVPGYKEGGGAAPEYYGRYGPDAQILDVDAIAGVWGAPTTLSGVVTGATEAASGLPQEGQRLTREQLLGVARRLALASGNKWIATAIRALVKGESFAESGNPGRHNTMIRICHEVLDQYQQADPAAFAQMFAPSLQVMQPTKLTLQEIETFARQKLKEPRAKHVAQIAEAFAWERATPYTDAEIAATADAVGARLMELQHRWVIQCGSSFYVLCGDKYWCYPRESVMSAIRRDLSPHPGIVLQTPSIKGQLRDKTLDEVMRDYGAVAVGVEVDLSAQKAYYNPLRRIMVEAPTPIAVEAEYSSEVETWLRLLAGPLAERLNQWLACVTRLREPCVALYLSGAPGTGKSVFLKGVARVYGTRAAELEGALDKFNEDVITNPVVTADEHLPEDVKGQVRTAAIRKFVQDDNRALNRKYRPPATVIGASRVIMAANDDDKLIHTTENLNNFDIQAITERFLVIPTQEEARTFLEANRPMIRRWIDNDSIAKHTVWLCENYDVVPYGRFLVKGEAKKMTNALTTSSGLRAGVCEWVMGLLQKPTLLINRPGMAAFIQVRDGRLLVTARVMAEAWNEYISERTGAPPTPSKISKALAGLSEEITVRLQNKTAKMRVFNLEQLVSWAEGNTGYPSDLAEIRELVANLEKSLTRPNVTVN